MKNYRIDFAHNTIIIDYKFNKAAQEYGSAEYKTLKGLQKDFPNMATVVASHRQQKTTHHNYRLTYENMEKYLLSFENYDELLAAFALVRQQSILQKSPYSFVRGWFLETFPNYEKTPKSSFEAKASFKTVEEKLSKAIA